MEAEETPPDASVQLGASVASITPPQTSAPSSPSKQNGGAGPRSPGLEAATAEAAKVAESIWSRIQASGILIPPEVIDKLAELDLELSEGQLFF